MQKEQLRFKIQGIDVLILDTAGRTNLDNLMMKEIEEIFKISNPSETLLVADSMTGQDAVNTASAFSKILKLTGVILTRTDGDAIEALPCRCDRLPDVLLNLLEYLKNSMV